MKKLSVITVVVILFSCNIMKNQQQTRGYAQVVGTKQIYWNDWFCAPNYKGVMYRMAYIYYNPFKLEYDIKVEFKNIYNVPIKFNFAITEFNLYNPSYKNVSILPNIEGGEVWFSQKSIDYPRIYIDDVCFEDNGRYIDIPNNEQKEKLIYKYSK